MGEGSFTVLVTPKQLYWKAFTQHRWWLYHNHTSSHIPSHPRYSSSSLRLPKSHAIVQSCIQPIGKSVAGYSGEGRITPTSSSRKEHQEPTSPSRMISCKQLQLDSWRLQMFSSEDRAVPYGQPGLWGCYTKELRGLCRCNWADGL